MEIVSESGNDLQDGTSQARRASRVSVGASRGPVLGRDKLCIRALGLLVSSHKNESSSVLRNSRETPLLFFERL